ncbi:glycosyltransferase family 4 protein [Ethanoligenens harbinense]|uniref:Glycosyl transferase group 1 n=1 Tax=Ethanoligenens harbinense (strain DSM 18485 / JCM 12961 / CGMCC 1.5033 / YUAN-3) TaxID=663278 RepID=E6U4X3_ETHHY|nr:glycosyltransferase family 4 protein [Ethanoligenens harbinense]ADU27858.1 glycosyl transferase group 1 [Ethanoligenens harbinense YUAN-3]AVQ96881.1 glycosyltransferase WbuB [Ethanoligenens harbinense YUAN-3]AYF42368.1 glycosyltransferase WbuB [Ethanoligenens harbinense]QCN93121.1 glycosyltransferase WbuB [Ethanoligenens harbinense]
MNANHAEKSPKPHLLIYAHYYHPDVASTGQILRELAEGLLGQFSITVICVVPSYGGVVGVDYVKKSFYFENINGVDVMRIRVPGFDKTNKLSRIKNISAYFFRAMRATTRVGSVDYVYSISQPPILGGLLGVWGKWVKHAKYIYNIQDFNPEQTIATGYSKNQAILKMMLMADKFSCKRADKVIVVGRDMVETLRKRFLGKQMPTYAFINNWIDENEIYPLGQNEPRIVAFKQKYGLINHFILMYSGNLGLYYDLENLIKVLNAFPKGVKTLDGRDVIFAFIGAGSMKEKLVRYQKENRMENVLFIPYQSKADLNYSLNAADVHWCVSAKGIKGVSVPSKLYGIMAAGKPVLAVLESGSEARLILEETTCGLVSDPDDYVLFEQHIRWFIEHAGSEEVRNMGLRGRAYLVGKLTKDISIQKYGEEILACGASHGSRMAELIPHSRRGGR